MLQNIDAGCTSQIYIYWLQLIQVKSSIISMTLLLCLVQELFKSTVDLADLFGLYFVMSQIPGKGQFKFMTAGVGWASAEFVMTGFVICIFFSQELEFCLCDAYLFMSDIL